MVHAVRRGKSMRQVAREFGTSLETIRRWVERAGAKRLDRVDWRDRPAGTPTPINRTSVATEEQVLRLRSALAKSDLGDSGADAIRAAMVEERLAPIPSRRTIGRILSRRGILDGRVRVRRPPPPIGWYLPQVASAGCELDSFDTVEGLILRGGIELTVLNGISVHGGLISCWPRPSITAADVVELLTSRWREHGLPGYAQFDNATIFQGPHQYRDVVGQVMRTCLLLGVTPVFAPPREPGFQNAVESLNGRWQTKVWRRFQHASIEDLIQRSDRWRLAAAIRHASRAERAPSRRPFPLHFRANLQAKPDGLIIFIRRCDDEGFVSLLGHRFQVASIWAHRLVRSEVDLRNQRIQFFALRRREPADQPLLAQYPYTPPSRPFRVHSK